ncbi:MAG: site-2 protease family protein [Patescibacteria group bacterium]|mgnify:CR=1 FL=1
METIFVILILLFAVVIPEVSHGYAALALGDHTAEYEGRLTLNPMRHLDPVGSFLIPLLGYLSGGIIIGWAKPVPFNPYNLRNQRWGEAMVAIAGPLSNIIIAVIFAVIIRASLGASFATEPFLFITGYLVFINIILAIFNLIPIPPLDGSKIIFSILPGRLSHLRQNLERFGIVLVLIFVFVLWRFIAPFAAAVFTWLVGIPFS